MSLDPKAEAALALHRFGVGPRAGSIAAIASDPRGALIAELDRPGAGRIADPDLLHERCGRPRRVRVPARAAGGAAGRSAPRKRAQPATQAHAQPERRQRAGACKRAPISRAPPSRRRPRPGPGVPQQIYLDEAKARIDAALAPRSVSPSGWSGSGRTISASPPTRAMCARSAAPTSARRSAPMCSAASATCCSRSRSHPAMLIYLDNARSIGPNSIAGIRQKRGLNENLAREILELHTLGVRSVYTQDDVTRFAKVITGWTFIAPRQDPARGGEFVFNPRMHEPGRADRDRQELSRRRRGAGPRGARRRSRAIPRPPSTSPPSSRAISSPTSRRRRWSSGWRKRFLDTDGDLKEVAKALVDARRRPGTRRAASSSARANGSSAALRAVGVTPPDIGPVMQAQNLLGEPLWRPPAPKGFADDSAPWLDGLAQRLDIANQLARRIGGAGRPEEVFEQRWRRSPRPRRGRRSRAPKAARRRWRCCSCRPNFRRR